MIKSIIGIAFDCLDANQLANFYVKLTGWTKEISTEQWAALRTPEGILLVFQSVENYVAPVWPWTTSKPQQQAHIDFYVEDLSTTVNMALENGAKKADIQYFEEDGAIVMFDPAGHPFCLSTVKQ